MSHRVKRCKMGIEKIRRCFSEPKYIVRLVALMLCLGVAMYQLCVCLSKILHPPISTHYTFTLNETVKYPSITVCRNPPYKNSKFEKFGLNPDDPLTFSNSWKDFDFGNYTLDDFFKEVTYSRWEVLPFMGFEGKMNNLQIEEFVKLRHGKCFKMSPLNETNSWAYRSGYLFYLRNSEAKTDITTKPASGYHVHIHEPTEMITEDQDQSKSFMEYIYIEVGEDLGFNLRSNEYRQLPTKDNHCSTELDYSRSRCRESCLQKRVTEKVKCSTPWMENGRFPRCTTDEETSSIVKYYNSISQPEFDHLCSCPRSCNITIYIPYSQSRKDIAAPNSILALYYTSNLVTVMEEVSGYDWNLFLGDLGGSLGFLLGLSVLGLIGAFEQLIEACIGKKENSSKKSEEKEEATAPKECKKGFDIYLNGVKYDYEENKY